MRFRCVFFPFLRMFAALLIATALAGAASPARAQLPPGFIAVSLLDAVNATLIKGDSIDHPFDNPEGCDSDYRLEHLATLGNPRIPCSAALSCFSPALLP